MENITNPSASSIFIEHCQRESSLSEWLNQHSDSVRTLLGDKGVVLLRGLNVSSSKQFREILSAISQNDLLSYEFRSTPRTSLKGNIYTSTEYPADQCIAQHNENAYTNDWPMILGFFCLIPPEQDGATPVCDSHVIYKALPSELVDKFEQKGLMYVRNFSEIDLPWQEVFQTDSRDDVEQICRQRQINFEWSTSTCLRIEQKRPATITHPMSGKPLWFNQAHLFHHSNLLPEVLDNLLQQRCHTELTRNVYFGDGEEISLDELSIIRAAYEKHTVFEPWQKGDVMLLDNMAFTHGRQRYQGNRKVLVGMSSPYSSLKEV